MTTGPQGPEDGGTTENVLPKGTPDQIVKGSLKLGGYRFRVGVPARTVSEKTAAATRARAYDEKTRALARSLVLSFSRKDPDLQEKLLKLAKLFKLDPQVLQDELDRQEAAWHGHQEMWTLRGVARTGLRVIDGTRRLARGVVEADTERARALMTPADQRKIDDDLGDYRLAQGQDQAGKLDARRLTREIVAAGQQQIGAFRDRRHLADTLDRLASGQGLPWSEMLQAGDTLDALLAEQGPPQVPGDAGQSGAGKPATGNRRGRQRQ